MQLSTGTAADLFNDIGVVISEGAILQEDSLISEGNEIAVDYIITAENGETALWGVTILDAPLSSENDIIGFTLNGVPIASTINTINNRATVQLSTGTAAALFNDIGVLISEGAILQEDSLQSEGNEIAVDYIITAENGETALWGVTILDAPDTIAPVITLDPVGTITLDLGITFIDNTATAIDDVDGNLTDEIVFGGTFTNTNTAGTFTRTYNVSDAAGNNAVQVLSLIHI